MARIIADACANHNGSRKLMTRMVKAAAKTGVDFIKFQSFRADKLIREWPDYKNALQYYKERELSPEDHEFLIEECANNKIGFLTTVFDLDTVDFLASIGIEVVKIASSDCNSWRLIRKCLDKFNAIVISTGMHGLYEVEKLAEFVGQGDMPRVTVMHCVSLYPTPHDKANLLRIAALMQMFRSVGYSDHTMGTEAAKLAVAVGCTFVEKHFTLDKNLPGKDQAISGTTREFAGIVAWRNKVQELMLSDNSFPDKAARSYIGKWGFNA